MASSGSFTTSSRGATQYPRNATFNWWQTGQSIDGNYTDIAWNFVLGGGTSNNATIAIYAGSITVNGATTNFNYGGAYKKNGFVLASGNSRIYHNADGTKAFNANGGVNIYGSSQWYGGSQDFWLNTIARASTPSLTNANFNIGDTITINTNRASSSFTHTVKIKYGSSTTTIATGVGASVTYNTSNIADALYALIPNAKSYTGGTIEVTTYNGGTVIGTKSCAYTANAVESAASPLFSKFTYADTNSTTTAITGNSAVLISGKSSLAVTISAANKATARKSATMKKYTYQVAGLTGEENYSTNQIVKNMGSPEVAQTELPSGTRDIVVTAIDSRGYSTAVTKRVTIVPYKAPTISASASRLNGFEAETTIKIAGAFSRIEVGGTAKNTVDANSGVQYRYKAQNTTTWGSWTNKTATIDAANGKVTVADFKLSLDNQNAYNFEVKITDKLQTTTGSFTVAVGQPAFYIGADGRVGVGGMPTKSKNTGEAGLLDVKGRYYGTEGEFSMNDAVNPDTPSGWASKYGNGRRFTFYNVEGKFTNQPSTYGFLETYLHGNEITQIWHRQASGQVFVRSGNPNGWYGTKSSAGVFTQIARLPGDWELVDSASLSSDTAGTTFLQVTVPTEFRGANVEYRLTIGAEFLASKFPSYPYLNCQKSNGDWRHDDKDFSYIRTAGVGNTSPNIYTATKVNPLAFEWVVTSNNCSCTAEVIVGRAGTGNFWNATGRAGGFSEGGASSVLLAARTQWATSISAFRIECNTITLVKGSHMSLWARKTNEKPA